MPRNDETQITKPAFRWTLNTIAVLVGFAAGFIAWGMTWQAMIAGADQNARNIARIQQQIEPIAAMARQIDNHAYRIDRAEERAAEADTMMRAVEHSLNQLSSDLRVTREILERIEANSRTPTSE